MKKFLCLLFLLMNLMLPLDQVQAASFDIQSTKIEAQILDNGDVHFKQEYLYRIDEVNGVWIDVDGSGHELLDLHIGVVDDNGQVQYFEENNSEAPGTYQRSEEGTVSRFKIFYPSENDTKTFVLDYRLASIVDNYQDTAEFNWRIVGSGISENLTVEARIYLPDRLDEDEHFNVWGHGSPFGKVYPVRETDSAYIDVQVADNPSHTFVEVHALFPPRLTAKNPKQSPDKVYQQKVKEEEARVEQDRINFERQQSLGQLAMTILTSIGILGLIMGIFRHRSLVKKANPQPAHVPEHLFQPPSALQPALASQAFVRSQNVADPNDFSSTLLDLARRGYLQIEEISQVDGEDTVDILPLKAADDALTEYEKDALALVTLEDGQALRLSDLGDLMEADEDYKERQQDLMDDFSDHLADQVDEIRPDKSPYERKGGLNFTLVFLVAIFSIVGSGLIGGFTHIVSAKVWSYFIMGVACAIILLVIFLVLFIRQPFRTYEADKQYRSWRAFGQMLKDIGQMDLRKIGSLALWEEYLVYAVAFGYGKKVIKAMTHSFSQEELMNASLPFSFYANEGVFLSHFNDSVSESVNHSSFGSSSYSGSNSGGLGGGFSSGSSGGGGGGSGAGGF